MSESEKAQIPKKMGYEEFFEVVVGKASALEKEINKKSEELTEWLLNELRKYAVDNDLPVPKWIPDKYPARGKPITAEKTEKTEPNDIEYEQVAIKVPKTIMEFLRKTDIDEGPAAWIEGQIREDVKAALDVAQPELWIKAFNLGPALKEE